MKRASNDGPPSCSRIISSRELAGAHDMGEHSGGEDAGEEHNEGMRNAGEHRGHLRAMLPDPTQCVSCWDAAYDTVGFYEAARARHVQVVVPPIMTARVSRHGPRSGVRDRAITDVEALGRRQWKKASGYHLRARVENAFFRYKSIIGAGLRARSRGARTVEASLACGVLNQMTELGRPESSAIRR